MLSYVVRRCLFALFVLVGVSILTFLLTRVAPSDPAARWVGPRATAEQITQARAELGLDKPLPVQYMLYVSSLLQGNWGISIRTHRPVALDLQQYLPPTVELIVFSMFFAVPLGVFLGVVSAARSGTPVDHGARLLALAGVGLPGFWLAMILQIVFFKWIGLFPLSGRVAITTSVERLTGFLLIDSAIARNLPALGDALWHLVLPAATLAAYPVGNLARMTRNTMLEVLGEDFIRVARAIGAPEARVYFKHALRNVLGTLLTSTTLIFVYSLVGSFVVESVFNWPGFGSYAALSIMVIDYPAIMGITTVVAVSYVVLNLINDLAMAVVDPRIRLS